MKKYIDFCFHPANLLPIAVLIISLLWINLCNVHIIYENSYYENTAVIPLIIAIIMCFKAKKHKVFFNVLAMFLILAIAREFSYGRVPFAQIPGKHSYYPWSHYKYGYLANIIVWAYVMWMVLYGLINKIWVDIKNIIIETTMPFWSFLMIIVAIGCQYYSERILHFDMGEEVAEYFIYTMVMVIVFLYTRKLNKTE